MTRVLAIDAGTTGVTALVVDETGSIHARGYAELPQHFPRPGWVEHDGNEIVRATHEACTEVFASAAISAGDLTAIGITNQRETALLWDRQTLEPVHRAIVWQDRRTAGACDALREAGHAETIRERSGLVVDAYFSGTKLAWLLDHVDGARSAAEAGRLAFGTIDSWLVAWLTGGAAHVTDPSNASRTMLFDIREGKWSDELCDLLRVPMAVLPEVHPNAAERGVTDPERLFGARLPITATVGDQQAALFGQGCWEASTSKSTYGTGSFVLLNTGKNAPSSERLITTVAWDLGEGLVYALEGSIFATGAAIQWLRDGLGVIADAAETGPLAEQVPDTGDVYLVPAFTGLGAPHWDPYARGILIGLTRGTTRAHLARAAVEAMAFQTCDVVEAMEADSGIKLAELRVDGGAVVMDLLCQLQADLLGVPVLRPVVHETTAMGAAFLAGLGVGVWSSTGELSEVWRLDRRFSPDMDDATRTERRSRWRQAVDRCLAWAPHTSEEGGQTRA
jgi:glycerol kinase